MDWFKLVSGTSAQRQHSSCILRLKLTSNVSWEASTSVGMSCAGYCCWITSIISSSKPSWNVRCSVHRIRAHFLMLHATLLISSSGRVGAVRHGMPGKNTQRPEQATYLSSNHVTLRTTDVTETVWGHAPLYTLTISWQLMIYYFTSLNYEIHLFPCHAQHICTPTLLFCSLDKICSCGMPIKQVVDIGCCSCYTELLPLPCSHSPFCKAFTLMVKPHGSHPNTLLCKQRPING